MTWVRLRADDFEHSAQSEFIASDRSIRPVEYTARLALHIL